MGLFELEWWVVSESRFLFWSFGVLTVSVRTALRKLTHMRPSKHWNHSAAFIWPTCKGNMSQQRTQTEPSFVLLIHFFWKPREIEHQPQKKKKHLTWQKTFSSEDIPLGTSSFCKFWVTLKVCTTESSQLRGRLKSRSLQCQWHWLLGLTCSQIDTCRWHRNKQHQRLTVRSDS